MGMCLPHDLLPWPVPECCGMSWREFNGRMPLVIRAAVGNRRAHSAVLCEASSTRRCTHTKNALEQPQGPGQGARALLGISGLVSRAVRVLWNFGGDTGCLLTRVG